MDNFLRASKLHISSNINEANIHVCMYIHTYIHVCMYVSKHWVKQYHRNKAYLCFFLVHPFKNRDKKGEAVLSFGTSCKTGPPSGDVMDHANITYPSSHTPQFREQYNKVN